MAKEQTGGQGKPGSQPAKPGSNPTYPDDQGKTRQTPQPGGPKPGQPMPPNAPKPGQPGSVPVQD